MSASNELRRVCVHAGSATIDLALPAALPLTVLIPSIVDVVAGRAPDPEATRYRLSLPCGPALAGPTTLAQNGIRDGAVLVLSRSTPPAPVARHDDVAEAVAATLGATASSAGRTTARAAGAIAAICLTTVGGLALVRNACVVPGGHAATTAVAGASGVAAVLSAVIVHRAYRDPTAGLTLGVVAAVFAAVAGFLAVPGRPGMANVLLAAAAAAVTSVLAMRLSGCGVVALTAVAGVATIISIAALAGVLTAAPPHAIGSASALVSVGLLGAAGRVSIVLAGLSPRLDAALPSPDAIADRVIRADRWLAGLLAAASCTAAVGAIVTALTSGGHPDRLAFAALTGSLLLLRARAFEGGRALTLAVGGLVTVATTFGVAAISSPLRGPWIAMATAILAAAAMYPGFVAPGLSPALRWGARPLEWFALVAMAPLTCWICGAYGAVRGLGLR